MEQKSNHNINSIRVLYLLFVVSVLQVRIVYSQQKANFTQYISNDLVINPAYAGSEGALCVTFFHRSQWSGIDGAPQTQSLAVHSLFKSKNIGLGLYVINDKIGIHGILTAQSTYAYRIQLKKETFLSLGLQFGLNQIKSDFNSLTNQIQNPNDPKISSSNLSEINFEFGSGIYFLSPRLNLGISMPNMLQEKIQTDSINYSLPSNNIYFLGRYKIPINSNVTLQPGILVKYLPGLPISYDMSLAAIINKVLLIGVSYRPQESGSVIIQAMFTPQFKIGYAYDYPLANTKSIGSNAHEIMISYLFSFTNKKISKPR